MQMNRQTRDRRGREIEWKEREKNKGSCAKGPVSSGPGKMIVLPEEEVGGR